jgi:peptidyl-prolyl cis-trans isomerase C
MKPMFILPLVALALTLPTAGQQAAAVDDGAKPVATINGEVITAARLDQLWKRVPPQVKDQYKNNGGKAAYLNNYLGKRLVIQEALKRAFDKRPDVVSDIEAAKESALFDRYVRDVVAAPIVTDEEIKKYYDEHPDDFRVPEKIKVRHIVMVANPTMQNGKTKEQALELMKKISLELHADPAFRGSGESEAAQLARVRRFAELAAHYSDDGAAQQGGDLGWVEKGMLDPDFEDAAFKLPLGLLSGIVETKYGYHIILVEQKKAAGMEPYDEAQLTIREFLMSQHAAEVVSAVTKLTNDLRNASKVAVYPENIR